MTKRLCFRAPGEALTVAQLVGRAWPLAVRDRPWRGAILVDGVPAASLDDLVEPGAQVVCEFGGGDAGADVWPSLRCSDPCVFVLAPSPPWQRGWVPLDGPGMSGEFEFEIVAEADGLAELRLTLPSLDDVDPSAGASFERARGVLDALHRVGITVLGDVWNGGFVASLGPAWRNCAEGPHFDRDDWPPPSPWPAVGREGLRSWAVSDATARVLGRGHPWIRPDDETEDVGRFATGERVRVTTRDGRLLGEALIDGPGAVSGRLIGGKGDAGWSVEGCVARALARRRRFMDEIDTTDAFRLVHGEADGLPGLFIDRLGSIVRVLVTARSAVALVDRALLALGRVIPDPWRIVEVLHLDTRNSGRFERVRVHAFSVDGEGALELGRRSTVRERGLLYHVASGLDDPERSAPGFGLFLDQRENRARFAKRARRGGRFLNLFAHTGAFSVALLAAGADSVDSVDLSGAYLRWLEENLALNADAGVDAKRHTSVRQDGRRHLEQLGPDDLFDGIVLDPPTAAAAGRRYFSVRRDLVPMVGHCLSHLAPGGALLLTLNDRKARRRLEVAVEEAAKSAGVRVEAISEAAPSRDFPRLDGFAEGDAFRGCWVERSRD